MRYIKIFEDFEDKLFIEIPHKEYESFSDRRDKISIYDEVPKIIKIIDRVFGKVDPFTLDGYDYKEYDTYGDYEFAYFRLPYKDKTMIPPGFNIVKYDDNWYLISYFPPRPQDTYSPDRKPTINYKLDTSRGLKELLIHLKQELS